MAFPWKKVKNTKISRFVNDHLHNSQKRRDGSSLVVETGFPTSLIDLFMKNREKLRKPSKKRRGRIPDLPPIDVNHQVISRSTTPYPSPVDENVVLYHFPSYCPSPLVSESIDVMDIIDDPREACVDANKVILVVFKLFLVVVLAFMFKRLTVGVTLSAFLLFFLEYVGKRLSCWLQPCLKSKPVSIYVEKNKEDELRWPVQEIELVKPEVDLVRRPEEFGVKNEFRRLGDQETKLKDFLAKEDEPLYVGGELTTRKSRKEKMKSKMKKLVPKKLRKSKKGEHSVESLDVYSEENNIELSGELEADQCEEESGSEILSSLSSSVPSRRYNEDYTFFHELTPVNNKAGTQWEVEGYKINGCVPIKRYLALCLIVLVGLIGGRVVALVLTLSWCLLLKFGETIQKYAKKAPVVRSFVC